MATESLNEEQIEQLLQEAETRSREKAGIITQVQNEEDEGNLTLSTESVTRKPLPRLKHGLGRNSYIHEKHGVVHVNPDLVVGKQQKKLADTLRTVDILEKSKKVVRPSLVSNFCCSNEEIYPNLILDADQQSFLDCPASVRDLLFIVTLTISTAFQILHEVLLRAWLISNRMTRLTPASNGSTFPRPL